MGSHASIQAIMVVNGDKINVEVVKTEAFQSVTRHDVKLLEPVQGCKVGDIVAGVYSYVDASITQQYGDTASIFFK